MTGRLRAAEAQIDAPAFLNVTGRTEKAPTQFARDGGVEGILIRRRPTQEALARVQPDCHLKRINVGI